MNVVNEYRTRIHQAETPEQKQALAAELHRLADSFDKVQREEYEQAMRELRQDVAQQLKAISPASDRAEAILKRYAKISA